MVQVVFKLGLNYGDILMFIRFALFTRAAILAGALCTAGVASAQQQRGFTIIPMERSQQPVVTIMPPQAYGPPVVYYDQRYRQSDWQLQQQEWQRLQEERYRRERRLNQISGVLRLVADGVQIFGGNGYYSGGSYYTNSGYGLTGGFPLTGSGGYYRF
jgi:hypothetical protein